MSVVTVIGASGAIIPVSVNGAVAYSLARAYAAAVNGFAADGRLAAVNLVAGVTPPTVATSSISGGMRGEGVIMTPGVYEFPKTYRFVTDNSTGPVTIDETHLHTNSSVLAGVGGTFIYGGTGGGSVIVGGGNNVFYGLPQNSGDYTVAFGDGNDTIYAGAGHDLIGDGAGSSEIFLGTNSSKLFSRGSDSIIGGSGQDTISMDGNNATVFGGTGALDVLIHGTNELVMGGSGADTFFASTGNNTLTGGAGDNKFEFSKGTGGTFTITDFGSSAGNLVGLFGYGASAVTDALATAKNTAAGAVITLSDKTTITFTNVQADYLTSHPNKFFTGS